MGWGWVSEYIDKGPHGGRPGGLRGLNESVPHRLAGFWREFMCMPNLPIPRDLTSYYSKDIVQD